MQRTLSAHKLPSTSLTTGSIVFPVPPTTPQMMRLLGHVPRRLVAASRRGPEFFNAQCQLWDAPRPPYWPLDKVLQEWHGLPEEEVGCCGRISARVDRLGAVLAALPHTAADAER